MMNSFFDIFSNSQVGTQKSVIPYGRSKNNGSHDHRNNKGEDRTSSQKQGDKKRKKT